MTERLGYELREIAGGTLNFAYQSFGAIISAPARGMVIFNTTNMPVYVWINAEYDDIRVPSGSSVEIFPYSKHNDLNNSSFIFKAGTQLKIMLADWIPKGGSVMANIYT